MDATEYRRPVGGQIWHWNVVCPKWPERNYERSERIPLAENQCPQCKRVTN